MRMNLHGHQPGLGFFVLGSLLLHALVVSFWHGEPAAGPTMQNSFRITVLARHGNASSTPDKGSQPDRETGSSSAPERVTEILASNTLALNRTRRNAVLQVAEEISGGRSTGQAVEISALEELSSTRLVRPDSGKDGQRINLSARSGSTSHGPHTLTSSVKHSRVLAALHEALFPTFNYPPLARRRGWQGLVDVGLHVEADGDLTRIHLVRSSGHALLDRAAIRNITELRSIPEAAQWLGDSDMDVVLPVLYQLVEQ